MKPKKTQTDEREQSPPPPHDNHRHFDRTLPDPAICRAIQIGADLVDCLVENPSQCRYALRFGHGHFCRHPERMEIVKRTEAEKKTKKKE